ncbi:hypothetical protein HON01_09945, partial [Candidatus Woesearchaeota archaeon]|nr:hypothetical protein [Candidatus Woesearchaeota archaeon]
MATVSGIYYLLVAIALSIAFFWWLGSRSKHIEKDFSKMRKRKSEIIAEINQYGLEKSNNSNHILVACKNYMADEFGSGSESDLDFKPQQFIVGKLKEAVEKIGKGFKTFETMANVTYFYIPQKEIGVYIVPFVANFKGGYLVVGQKRRTGSLKHITGLPFRHYAVGSYFNVLTPLIGSTGMDIRT